MVAASGAHDGSSVPAKRPDRSRVARACDGVDHSFKDGDGL